MQHAAPATQHAPAAAAKMLEEARIAAPAAKNLRNLVFIETPVKKSIKKASLKKRNLLRRFPNIHQFNRRVDQ